MDEPQICSRCKQTLAMEKFSPSQRGKRGTWCRACLSEYNRGQRGPSIPHEPRDCAHCGATYVPAAAKKNAVGFCSRRCKVEAMAHLRAKERLARKPVERRCIQCEGILTQDRRADIKFCSDECAGTWRNRNKTPEQRRGEKLWANYKITPEDYDGMLIAQSGKCAICLDPEPKTHHGFWHVDHCHTTGAVRGLLCGPCNTGIGQLQDDPDVIDRAAAYLRKAREGSVA